MKAYAEINGDHKKTGFAHLLFFTLLSVCISIQSFPVPECRAGNEMPEADDSIDFTTFTLEELKNVEIISASKKPERISDIPAAVFVITREDIRRSGVTSIPEALRLAPGVQVARSGATDWAITIRGLNQEFANNLLVLIDGRSVYTPVFSGVHWDVQDTILEDIERIEVIRGPGASVWGANAVNGVINIITRNASDTLGSQILAQVGNQETYGSMRHGDTVGRNTHYRIYAKCFNRDRYSKDEGSKPDDNWESVRGGFRIDMNPGTSEADTLTLQGEIYENHYDTEIEVISSEPPYISSWEDSSDASGEHILGRWQHVFSETSDIFLQFYYDRAENDHEASIDRVQTYDLDFRHHSYPFSRHEIIWGLGYRFIRDEFSRKEGIESFQIDMRSLSLDQDVYSAFIQDKFELLPGRLTLTLGSRFEHNDHTGFEIQPNIRFLWTPVSRHTLWGSVSRAVRTPSRSERDIKIVGGILTVDNTLTEDDTEATPAVITLFGNEHLDSEKLIACEMGWRIHLAATLWLDAVTFYNKHDNLIINKPENDYLDTESRNFHYVIPLPYKNSIKGRSYGFELSADWHVSQNWRITGSYTYLSTDLDWKTELEKDMEAEVTTEAADLEVVSSPRNQISLRSSMDITEHLEFDLWLRYVGNLSENDVDSYITLDARVGWKLSENIGLSVVGQNLLEKAHHEFSRFEVERGAYFKLDWQF